MKKSGMRQASLLMPVLTLSTCFVMGCANASNDGDGGPEGLEDRIVEIEQRLSTQEILYSGNSVAYLTPADEGYSIVNSDMGALSVQLSNIREYSNGSKATLTFGNPLAATLQGLSATIEWGRVDESGEPVGNVQSKDTSFTEDLGPGAWTKVQVVLPNIPPKELGFVRIRKVTHRGVLLNNVE